MGSAHRIIDFMSICLDYCTCILVAGSWHDLVFCLLAGLMSANTCGVAAELPDDKDVCTCSSLPLCLHVQAKEQKRALKKQAQKQMKMVRVG